MKNATALKEGINVYTAQELLELSHGARISDGGIPWFTSISMPQFSRRTIRELIREVLRLLGSYLATGSNPDPERVQIISLPF